MQLEPRNPTQGSVIRYVLAQGRRAGEVRAAVVTNTFDAIRSPSGEVKYRTPAGKLCNGTVFVDELNDQGTEPSERFFGSAAFDDSPTPAHGTWHWPPLEGVEVAERRESPGVTIGLELRGFDEAAATALEDLVEQLRERAAKLRRLDAR